MSPTLTLGNPIESDLEDWARRQIKAAGGLMLKWTCPGVRGVPDNIIFWHRPGARRGFKSVVHLAEFKILNRQPNQQQQEMHALLISKGAVVFIPRCREDVLSYIKQWRPT